MCVWGETRSISLVQKWVERNAPLVPCTLASRATWRGVAFLLSASVRVPCSVGVILSAFPIHWAETTAARASGRLCFLRRVVGVMPVGPLLRTHLTAKGARGSDLPQEQSEKKSRNEVRNEMKKEFCKQT